MAPWAPLATATHSAAAATAVLPDPTSPCRSRLIGTVRAEISNDLLDDTFLRPRQGKWQARKERRKQIAPVWQRPCGRASKLPAGAQDAELQQEQLVEAQPAASCRKGFLAVREMGLRQRSTDGQQPILLPDRRGDNIRNRVGEGVQGISHDAPQPAGVEALSQRIGGDQPRRVDLQAVQSFEFRGSHLQLPAVALHLAAEGIGPTAAQLPLDVGVEPGHEDFPGAVAHSGRHHLAALAQQAGIQVPDRTYEGYLVAIAQPVDRAQHAIVVITAREQVQQVSYRPDANFAQPVGQAGPDGWQAADRRIEAPLLPRFDLRWRRGAGPGRRGRHGRTGWPIQSLAWFGAVLDLSEVGNACALHGFLRQGREGRCRWLRLKKPGLELSDVRACLFLPAAGFIGHGRALLRGGRAIRRWERAIGFQVGTPVARPLAGLGRCRPSSGRLTRLGRPIRIAMPIRGRPGRSPTQVSHLRGHRPPAASGSG